jgi:hypothetical protein
LEAAGLHDGVGAPVANSRREAALQLWLLVTDLMPSLACSGRASRRRSAAAALSSGDNGAQRPGQGVQGRTRLGVVARARGRPGALP